MNINRRLEALILATNHDTKRAQVLQPESIAGSVEGILKTEGLSNLLFVSGQVIVEANGRIFNGSGVAMENIYKPSMMVFQYDMSYETIFVEPSFKVDVYGSRRIKATLNAFDIKLGNAAVVYLVPYSRDVDSALMRHVAEDYGARRVRDIGPSKFEPQIELYFVDIDESTRGFKFGKHPNGYIVVATLPEKVEKEDLSNIIGDADCAWIDNKLVAIGHFEGEEGERALALKNHPTVYPVTSGQHMRVDIGGHSDPRNVFKLYDFLDRLVPRLKI